LAVAYNYGYYEALSIPLIEIEQIISGAEKECERKILFREAILNNLGVNR